jgi:RNA polymerase primary sigma factor
VKKAGAKAKLGAKKPALKVKAGAKPALKALAKHGKPVAPTKVANGKQVPALKAGAKAVPPAKGVPAAKPGAPVAAAAHKPTASEIAAKLAGKRAEDVAKKGKNGKHADLAPRELTPADVEARKRRLKTLIVLGKERGFLTYAEINDHLPDDIPRCRADRGRDLDDRRHGHPGVRRSARRRHAADGGSAGHRAAEDVEEEAEAAASTLDSEFGRTTDPVRMYMREMGSVELLTREGEIEIAKRIERA